MAEIVAIASLLLIALGNLAIQARWFLQTVEPDKPKDITLDDLNALLERVDSERCCCPPSDETCRLPSDVFQADDSHLDAITRGALQAPYETVECADNVVYITKHF